MQQDLSGDADRRDHREGARGARRRCAAAALGLFLALAGLYGYTSPGRIDMIDGQFRYEVARNWLDLGRPVIVDRHLIPIGLSVITPSGVYAQYNAAASLAAMPFMRLSRALPGHTVERDRFVFSMTGPVFGAALGALLVAAYSALGLSLARAVAWALVWCVASLWWPGSTTIFDQNQHGVWLLLAVLLAWESGRRGSTRLAALAGVAGAVLINYQENYALLLPAVGLAVAPTVAVEGSGPERRLASRIERDTVLRYVVFGLVCGLGLLGFLAFNYLRFGAPGYPGRYTDPSFFARANPAAALFGLFLSPGKSVILFSPPVVLAALGARRLFRRAPALAIAIAVASIIHVVVIMQLAFFGGEWCWGPRYLIPLLPLWALAVPFAATRTRRWLIATVVSAGVLSQLLGLSLDHQRFFLERNLAPHFWAADEWFYARNSQLLARVTEIYTTWRDGVPAEAVFFSPTPRREITYSIFGPRRPEDSSSWMRQFGVFYRPRPWPFWMADIDPARQPVDPWPWLLLCGAAMLGGGGLVVWSIGHGHREGVPEPRSDGIAAAGDSRPPRLAIALGCCALIAVPFVAVRFPPIADLPQHVAQVRLFWETLHDPGGPYRIQWLTPYWLAYVIVGAMWRLVSPESAGRLALLVIGALWVGAGHLLAKARGRSPAAAIVGSVLLFNHTLYWGFYSFALGWPIFAGWLLLTSGRRAHRAGWRDALGLLAAASLLYATHALWLAAAVLWFAVSSVWNRTGPRTTALRFLSFSSVLVVAAIWYPGLAARGFESPTRWFVAPWNRLSGSWLAEAVFGGLRGPAEFLMLGALASWIGVALYQRRRELRHAVDGELLLAAAMLGLLALTLPDLHTNTIAFAKRWAPCAAALLVIGCPVPRCRPALRYAAAFGLLAAVVATTTAAWIDFERRGYDGLAESLRTLPDRPRVIGLDLAPDSDVVKGRPFIQAFAYAQVLHGGELNFSFADFAPSPVVYKLRRRPTWTWGLEWFPGRVRRSDLDQFDYGLVNADETTHRQFAEYFGVAPVTHHGRWRLYRLHAS